MKLISVFLISIITISTLGCSTIINENTKESVKTSNLDKLKIETSPSKYAPTMSSAVGILLKPVNIDTNLYKLVFKTKEGFFLNWGKDNNYQVRELNKEVVYDKDLYWSYNYDSKFSENQINITVFDKLNNQKLKEIILNIEIKDGFASIKD